MLILSRCGKFFLPLLLAVTLFGFSRVPALGLGLLVPAYFYPSWWDSAVNQWDDLIEAADQVPLVAIMNPNSGPGEWPNPDYTHEVDALRAAGGQVIGYVHTSYANRPIDEVLAEVDAYYAWYGVDGIYFDEVTSDESNAHVAYYQKCYDYVLDLDPAAMVVLGHGTEASKAYVSAATKHLIRENDNDILPFMNWTPAPWTANYGPDRFTVLTYNLADVDGMKAAVDHALTNNVSWVYFTDDTASNPWDTLPSYWAEEVEKIKQSDSDLISLQTLTTTTLIRKTGYKRRRVKFRVSITNTSPTALSSPLLLVIESISEPSVAVKSPDGTTEDGKPFFDLTDQIQGGTLDPKETTNNRTIVFKNPSRKPFTVQTGVYQQRRLPTYTTHLDTLIEVRRCCRTNRIRSTRQRRSGINFPFESAILPIQRIMQLSTAHQRSAWSEF